MSVGGSANKLPLNNMCLTTMCKNEPTSDKIEQLNIEMNPLWILQTQTNPLRSNPAMDLSDLHALMTMRYEDSLRLNSFACMFNFCSFSAISRKCYKWHSETDVMKVVLTVMHILFTLYVVQYSVSHVSGIHVWLYCITMSHLLYSLYPIHQWFYKDLSL